MQKSASADGADRVDLCIISLVEKALVLIGIMPENAVNKGLGRKDRGIAIQPDSSIDHGNQGEEDEKI